MERRCRLYFGVAETSLIVNKKGKYEWSLLPINSLYYLRKL